MTGRGNDVISVTLRHDNLSDRTLISQVATQLSLRDWVDPITERTTQKHFYDESIGNRTYDLIVSSPKRRLLGQ